MSLIALGRNLRIIQQQWMTKLIKLEKRKKEADKLVFVLQQMIAGDEQRKVHKNLSFAELAQQQHDDQDKLRIQLEVLAQDGSGLNRISMTTKTLFESNEKLCKQLYGFPDFVFLIDFLESAFDVKYEKPKNVKISFLLACRSRQALTRSQRLI